MARTRSIPDTTIAHAAAELLVARGPGAVTFAEVSQRCGLAPPTLVQRFGSRAGLLDAVAVALRLCLLELFDAAWRDPASSHLALLSTSLIQAGPLQDAACRLSRDADTSAFSHELRKQISLRLAIAVEGGELPRCDVAQLARTLQIAFAGAVATASIEGRDLAEEVTSALAAQLDIFI
jgi:AcrR family transcriptional regulator